MTSTKTQEHEPAWLREAARHLDFHEGPNNQNPFGRLYNLDHEPWCALFVSFCCRRSRHPLPSMQSGMPDGYAGVYSGMMWAKEHGFWRPSWEAKPGDAIVYGWDGPGSSPENMHTGFIVSAGPKGRTGHTLEGNRGDQVERQTFVVGAPTVLGTIAITEILAPRVRIPRPRPQPQPRHPAHPDHSGPTPLAVGTKGDLDKAVERLDKRKRPVQAGHGDRHDLRRAAAAIARVLAIKPKDHK